MQIFANSKLQFYFFMKFYVIALKISVINLIIVPQLL